MKEDLNQFSGQMMDDLIKNDSDKKIFNNKMKKVEDQLKELNMIEDLSIFFEDKDMKCSIDVEQLEKIN